MTTLTRNPHVNKYTIAAAINAEVQRRAGKGTLQRAPTKAPTTATPRATTLANVTDHIPMRVIVDELRDIAEQIPSDPKNAVAQLNDLINDLTSQSPNR